MECISKSMMNRMYWTTCWLLLAGATACAAADPPPADRELIVHVLNRLGYGPRPGDVERVREMGLDPYLRAQLHPETIPDRAVEQKLVGLVTLKMSGVEMAAAFRREKEEKRRAETERAKAGVKKKLKPKRNREGIAARAPTELRIEKIIRAVESERQLNEVLVDFWSNHFNIDIRKNSCRILKPVDEREVIRPHIFGRFRDLLGASAKSPAMLVYLDNARNFAPDRRTRPNQPAPKNPGGLNENYARELMELHTLGVNGGYTQEDVVEVARCFTGWTVDQQSGSFRFAKRRHDTGRKTVLGNRIAPNKGLEDGEKVLDILSRHPATARFIAAKLCRRLVSDDPPSALVDRVAKKFLETDGDLRRVYAAIVFSPEFASPEVYRAKIKSPFEYAVSAVRATGAMIDADASRRLKARRQPLLQHIAKMGQPLYAFQAPTGWPEDSQKWISTGALISRLNFALAFAVGRVGDVDFSPVPLMDGVDIDQPFVLIDRLVDRLLHGPVSPATHATLIEQITDNQGYITQATIDPVRLIALILGSPEFQRR